MHELIVYPPIVIHYCRLDCISGVTSRIIEAVNSESSDMNR